MSVSILFLLSAGAIVSCSEYVPVLLWSTQTTQDSFSEVPALSRLTSNEFTDYLLKRVKVENPLVLVFMEENLSSEDFSWRDMNGNGAYPMLNNITRMADDVAFFPSVHEPYRAIRKLKNHGYVWRNYEKQDFESLKDGKNAIFEVKLNEPYYLENRPDMLKRHDEKMAKVFNEALSYKQNVMVIYSGIHTSWIDADLGRFKREERENGSSSLIISDDKNVIRMAVTPPIIFKIKSENEDAKTYKIYKVMGIPTIQESKGNITFRVRFPLDNGDVSVNFIFTSDGSDWWSLNNAEIAEMKEFNLIPSINVSAPNNFSFFCNPEVKISNKKISFTFENFQVQPRVGEGQFGPVVHCIPYFSIAIWSGLVIVFILSIVLAWGITMIMDINTNDRFDDPKGKTITITATD